MNGYFKDVVFSVKHEIRLVIYMDHLRYWKFVIHYPYRSQLTTVEIVEMGIQSKWVSEAHNYALSLMVFSAQCNISSFKPKKR